MNRAIALVAMVLVVGAIVPIGAVAAPGTTNSTANATETQQTTTTVGGNIVGQLSPATTVTEATYSDGTWHVTIDTEISTAITITEATPTKAEGSANDVRVSQFEQYRYDVDRGETTIHFDAPKVNGYSAISIVSTETGASEQNTGVRLETGDTSSDPFQSFGGTSGLLTGIGMAAVLSALAAWYVVRQNSAPVRRAE